MSKCCIGIGRYQSNYKYLIYCMLAQLVEDITNIIMKLFEYDNQNDYPELYRHLIIQQIYMFFLFIIFGLILLCKHNNKQKSSNPEELGNKSLIFHKRKIRISDRTSIIIAFICFIFLSYYILSEILYALGFYDCELWPFNIFFGLFFMKYYFKERTSLLHKIYPLGIVSIIDLGLVIGSSFMPKVDINVYEYVENVTGNKCYIIYIFLAFIFNSFIISFARVYCKKVMETKYVSAKTIIFIFGCLGLIVSIVIISITSNKNCTNKSLNCPIENENLIYLDHFSVYIRNLGQHFDKHKGLFFIEILFYTPFISLCKLIKHYLILKIIFYLIQYFIYV